MPTLHDDEFGAITIRRSAKARSLRIRVAPDGSLRASIPPYAPMFLLRRLIKTSRTEIRNLLNQTLPRVSYVDGQRIGKSHTLVVHEAPELTVSRQQQRISVGLPHTLTLNNPRVLKELRPIVIAALRVEAKKHLPHRLDYTAAQYGFRYRSVRFSHASSRWGSCSSTGTISLNIALMKLPFELIDYVLIHELAHTVEMNHSDSFWRLVERADPLYKTHRNALKKETPSL